TKVDKLTNNHCPVCNERFPFIELVREVCCPICINRFPPNDLVVEEVCCLVCNERFLPINLVVREFCRRCYADKNPVKKFSAANNMDPGDVPEELQDLTEIEEMLIAQIFPIVSVYCLRGGQYSYRVMLSISLKTLWNSLRTCLEILRHLMFLLCDANLRMVWLLEILPFAVLKLL